MKVYQDKILEVLRNGTYKQSRTESDTISTFALHYKIDLSQGFPLLTTKKMDDYRWNSFIHEFLWYLSGEENIRSLRKNTKIWNNWADENGNLETAYGRFWRRFPLPEKGLEGEVWLDESSPWVNIEKDGTKTVDQIKYITDTLKEIKKNPKHSNLRRLVVSAWHPGNAIKSKLPPCHYEFAFYVQDNKLGIHLTQRSGDIALGIPFNTAAYSLLNILISRETEFEPGFFSHTIIDAHIYCGKGRRGEFYKNNLGIIKKMINESKFKKDYKEIKRWIEARAPLENKDDENSDHIPNLLEQVSRKPRMLPSIEIADKLIDELSFDDFKLLDYNSHGPLYFKVAT